MGALAKRDILRGGSPVRFEGEWRIVAERRREGERGRLMPEVGGGMVVMGLDAVGRWTGGSLGR